MEKGKVSFTAKYYVGKCSACGCHIAPKQKIVGVAGHDQHECCPGLTVCRGQFKRSSVDRQVELMREWFYTNYESVIHLPCVDGEYRYIRGGPYETEDLLNRFEELASRRDAWLRKLSANSKRRLFQRLQLPSTPRWLAQDGEVGACVLAMVVAKHLLVNVA